MSPRGPVGWAPASLPFLALGSRPPLLCSHWALKTLNLGRASLLSGPRCDSAGPAACGGQRSLSAFTAPPSRVKKRYLYLNRTNWPPERRTFQLCPEASGRGLPLQQENSQQPQHGPTPFTASPNVVHSACTGQESCTSLRHLPGLDGRTQGAGHSSWEGTPVPWQQHVALRCQTSPVGPSASRRGLLGCFFKKAAPADPGAFKICKPRHLPRQIQAWPRNRGPR